MAVLVDCEVWCVEREAMDLGLKSEGDCWLPILIDFSSLVAVKCTGETENEFPGSNKAVLYFANGEHFIVNTDYEMACNRFREAKNTIK